MRQAEMILEYYENRIRDVEAGGRCSPQLREAVSRYNTLLKNMTLPQAWAIGMEDQEAWQPIDAALDAVWVAIDQEDAGRERKDIRDVLREIRQLAEGIVKQNESRAEVTSSARPTEEGWFSPFTFQEDGVVYEKVHYPLNEKQIAILRLLDGAKGLWISSTEMGDLSRELWKERIDRHVKSLPGELGKMIVRQTGRGYRLALPRKA